MKIVFFTASINIGGIERVFLSYATGLLQCGYDVHYITCWDNGDFSSNFPQGIEVHSLGNIRLRYSIIGLKNMIKDIQPDIIITGNDSTMVVYFAKLLSGCRKLKIITSLHSYYNNSETLFYTKPIIKYIFPKCEKIIAVSRGIAEMLSKDFDLKAPKVVVLNNPNNLDLIIKESLEVTNDIPQGKYMVFVGRMTPVKNLKFLIDSYIKFHYKNPEYSLLLIGDGYVRYDVEEYVKKQKSDHFIKFVGIRSNPYPFIKNAIGLILPSTSEAFPTVLIEAMTLGITCIATPTKGAIDILDNGRLGYLSSSFTDTDEFSSLFMQAVNAPLSPQLLLEEVRDKYCMKVKSMELSSIIQTL